MKNLGDKKPSYVLRNPQKYIGDPDKVIARSTWETTAFEFCDNNPNILFWCSEEIKIPYIKPVLTSTGQMSSKLANYYPDLYVEYLTKDGQICKELIEIKPKKQTRASKARNYSTNLFENMAYTVNMAKWEAAKRWCTPRGITFFVLTEDSLFNRNKHK